MANSFSAYNPQIWSRKSVALLRQRCVMPKLVRTDFSEDLAQAGDIVNTRKPATFTAGAVSATTGVTGAVSNASATNIAIQLTNHKHVTFAVTDREATSSFLNLVEIFLDPAMLALAVQVDTDLTALYSDAIATLTVTSAGNWRTQFNAARTKLNQKLAPDTNRVAVLHDDNEGDVGNIDIFMKVNEAGTTQAMREGSVGRLKGFDIFRCSNITGVGSPVVRKNLFFHRDAIALVTRPLATAANITPGAVQNVAIDPDAGLSIRVTMSYNPTLLSSQVTCDLLYGVKTLDSNLLVTASA